MTKPLALIIEDDPQINQLFALTLGDYFNTDSVQDGEEALVYLSRLTPDLVILDVYLPRVSGAQILDYLRSEGRLAKTRVILVTADARQAEFLHDKADVSLIKPINPLELRELARRLYTTA